MDLLWIILGSLAIVTGLAGCILPVLPGPPIAWVGLLLLQFTDNRQVSGEVLVFSAAAVVLVTVLDYVVPVYGTKKFGGTKAGVWGSTIGLVVGLFIGPFGIIAGPFIGALLGELVAGQAGQKAFKAALGSFIGFLTGVFAKIAVVAAIAIIFIRALI